MAKPEYFPYVNPFWNLSFEFLSRAKQVVAPLVQFVTKVVWPKAKEVAIAFVAFTWKWTKWAAVTAADAVFEFCDRLLKPIREINAERRLEQALCLHSDVQNLEIAGVLQTFTKSSPRIRNEIPEALAA